MSRLLAFISWRIFFLPMIIPVCACAQTKEDYKAKGDLYYEVAELFFGLEKLDSVIHYGDLAVEEYRKAEDWELYINSKNILSTGYYRTGNYGAYQKSILETIKEAKYYSVEESEGMGNAVSNYAVFLKDIGDHNKSIQYFKWGMEIEEKTDNNEGKIITLGNLATVYIAIGDYDKALSYSFKALEIGRKSNELSLPNVANLLRKIGNIYIEKEELDSARVYFNRSIQQLKDYPNDKVTIENKIKTNLDIAKLFFKKENPDSTRLFIEYALKLSKGENKKYQGRAFGLLGNLSCQQGQYKKAISFLEKSKLLVIKEFSEYEKHYLIAEKDIALAKSFDQIQDFESALKHYQKALQMLSHDALELDVYTAPSLENIYSRLNFLDALSGKANTFFKKYKKQKHQKDLEAAYETFLLATELIQIIRKDYERESSLLRFSSKVLPIYEGAISAALTLNEKTKDEKYLNQAYLFSESNKAILLLESINDNIAKGFAGIPDSLLEKENRLKHKLAFLKDRLNEAKNIINKGEANVVETLRSQLFDVNKEYNELILRFEKEFPKYYQLKHNNHLARVKEVQSKLKNTSSALIEYFFGEKSIYAFTITDQKVFVKRFDKDDQLLASIVKVRNFLSQPPKTSKAGDEYAAYIKCAHDIYKKIVKKALVPEIDHLIIIADDRLGYLPFEALLTDLPLSETVNYSTNNLSYLIEAYTLNYYYSGTLFCDKFSKDKPQENNSFLGFAPSFNAIAKSDFRTCNNEVLSSLNCNQMEVQNIKEMIGGEIFLSDRASKSSFEQKAPFAQVIHLATHACIDDENPEFSRIHFADDYLSSQDLYNMQLNADLAVLSACDTGSGRLVKGEGVMSLARGFIHAGCASVVMSLWSVDDCATSEIMNGFYKYLKAGEDKSKAIQMAKLNFISSAKKAQQHPYYWAGFIQIGDASPLLRLKKSYPIYIWIIAFASILFLSIYFFLK